MAGAGDVNGDGYDDVIVGAQGYEAGELNEGAAFVLLGGPTECDDSIDNDGDGLRGLLRRSRLQSHW